MLFSVFYVGDSCQGWGREFESPFPLQIQKALIERWGFFIACDFSNLIKKPVRRLVTSFTQTTQTQFTKISEPRL